MILSHEDLSAIEASLGPEKAAPIINALEKLEREQKIEVKRDLLMELATKADLAELKGEIKRMEMLIKVLIGLAIVAIGLFSPAGVELIKFLH